MSRIQRPNESLINRMIDPTRRQVRHRRQRPHFVRNIVINRMLSRTNQIIQAHGKNRPETRFVDLLKRVSHHPQQRLAFKIRFNREAMSMHRPRIGFIKYARFITDESMGKLNIVIEYRLKGFAEWSNKSINPRPLHGQIQIPRVPEPIRMTSLQIAVEKNHPRARDHLVKDYLIRIVRPG